MKVAIELMTGGQVPTRAYPGDAGFDLYAAETAVIPSGGRRLISTGFKIAIPDGTVGYICSRSGLAVKHGVCVLNAPGILDAGYRGECKVVLANTGADPFPIEIGMRIAQMVIAPVLSPVIELIEAPLPASARSAAGFGSTGT